MYINVVHACVVTVGEDEVRFTASKEEQQRLLQVVEQLQKIGHAKDVQISLLQNENELVQDKSK